MGRSSWYKKWELNRGFSIENDKLLPKIYLLNEFRKTDMYGYQNGDLRKEIYIDILSRYYHTSGFNVLNPTGLNTEANKSFLESKKYNDTLDDSIPDIYKNELKELGIGINNQKTIDMRHNEYVSNCQLMFLDLYDLGYIKYEKKSLYYDSNKRKTYNTYKDGSYKEMFDTFQLDVLNLIPQIISDIDELNIDNVYKDKLKNFFDLDYKLELNLTLSNQHQIKISLENIEYIGALKFILVNPDYVDLHDFSVASEYSSIVNFLTNPTSSFAYSGVNLTNPLTGEDVPIFISLQYDTKMHLGFPAIDQEDLAIAKELEISVKPIIEDGLLINSDFLDGMDLKTAKEKVIEAFIESDIGTLVKYYKNTKINLSSIDVYGILYPLLIDEKGKLNSLREYLPYSFSKTFRPVLDQAVDVKGEMIKGTISHLFTIGVTPILSILYDEFSQNISMFSDSAKELYKEWLPINTYTISESDLYATLLMPIVIYNIIKKEIGYDIPPLFNNVVIFSDVLDYKMDKIERQNNNLISIDKLYNKYYADSIRIFYSTEKPSEQFIFNIYQLEEIDKFVKKLKEELLKDNIEDNKLDFYFASFNNDCSLLLKQNKIKEYIDLVISFSKDKIINNNISKENLLTYLKCIFPLMPYLAEEIYEIKINPRYSIINEDFKD